MKSKLLILSALTALVCVSCGREEISESVNAPKSSDNVNAVDKTATEKGNIPYYKVTVKEYDADGGYVEHTEVKNCFNDVLLYDGDIYSRYECKYNSEGLILEYIDTDRGSDILYRYDKYGNLTCKISDYGLEPLGVQTERLENEYDTSGRLVKCTMFTSLELDGETFEVEGSGVVREYKYDEIGNLSEQSDVIYGKHTYTYDDRGNAVVREETCDYADYVDRFVSEYNSRDLPVVEEWFRDGEPVKRWEYEYEFYDEKEE